MAAAKDAHADLTSCPICLETYTNPRCLPCLHNFCEGCLQAFIDKSFAKKDSGVKGINCPICRLFVDKPDSTSVQDWARQFPGNHIINSVIDLQQIQTQERNCHSCARENETESAKSWCFNCWEALCKTCERYHRQNKASRNHRLVDIYRITSNDRNFQTQESYCPDHPDKVLEAYCSDHSKACCTSCVLLKHRKCEDVGPIEDAATKLRDSDQLKYLRNSFKNMIKHLNKMNGNRKQNIESVQTSISDIKKEINGSFDWVINHFRKLQASALDEVSMSEKTILPELQSESEDITCKISALENFVHVIDSSLAHASPANLLNTARNLSTQKTVLKKFIKQIETTMKEIHLSYTKNQKLKNLLHTVGDLGTLSTEKSDIEISNYHSRATQSDRVDMFKATPKLLKDVDISGFITQVTVLHDDRVLISKHTDRTLALLTSDLGTVSTLAVPAYPWGIKMISSVEGALVISNKCLLFFKVNGDDIIETKKHQVPVLFDFIYHQNHYYTGSRCKVIVHDSLFCHVRDIAVDGDVFYMAARDDTALCYTVCNRHTLYCITLEGTTVFHYSHDKLRYATGVAVDPAGFIYVCAGDSNNVHQLTHDGKLQRIIIDNMSRAPRSISLNRRCTLLVIGCDNKVLLYDLREASLSEVDPGFKRKLVGW